MPTIAITGFPNVGKTTLLRDLTGSAPEIKPYSFTTKRLNFGYVEIDEEKIQVIDTPGTLARENKMNTIERMSYVAMRTAADLLVYVWDPTVQYTIELQKRLFDKIRDYDTEIVHYVSKSDLVDDAKEKFAFVDAVDTVDELKEVIQSSL
jgi:nucleolar GTP-binding protein